MANVLTVGLTDEQYATAQRAADEQHCSLGDVVERWIAVAAILEKQDLDTRQKHKDLEAWKKENL